MTRSPATKRRLLLWLLVPLLACGFAVAGLRIWHVAADSLSAEETLHATCFAVSLVDEFVRRERRWPRSWSELENLKLTDEPAEKNLAQPVGIDLLVPSRLGGYPPYDWPGASPEIQKRVFIDFSANLEAVAAEEQATFSAIQPIGPCYPYRSYPYVHWLLSTVKAEIARSGQSRRRSLTRLMNRMRRQGAHFTPPPSRLPSASGC